MRLLKRPSDFFLSLCLISKVNNMYILWTIWQINCVTDVNKTGILCWIVHVLLLSPIYSLDVGLLLLCQYDFLGHTSLLPEEWKTFHGLLLVCRGKIIMLSVLLDLIGYFGKPHLFNNFSCCRDLWHGHWLFGDVAWSSVLSIKLLVYSYISYQVSSVTVCLCYIHELLTCEMESQLLSLINR